MDTNEKGISKFFLIAFFLGGLGVHRFMTGKPGTGVLWLLSSGGLLIGWILDLIKIYKGEWK